MDPPHDKLGPQSAHVPPTKPGVFLLLGVMGGRHTDTVGVSTNHLRDRRCYGGERHLVCWHVKDCAWQEVKQEEMLLFRLRIL